MMKETNITQRRCNKSACPCSRQKESHRKKSIPCSGNIYVLAPVLPCTKWAISAEHVFPSPDKILSHRLTF